MIYPAHIRIDEYGKENYQTVAEHNKNVAKLCMSKAEPLGLAKTGYLLGILHDMGKYTDEYADYITRASKGEKVKRGSVTHTFAPVQMLFERYSENDRAALEIASFVIGSHHGLFDCISVDGLSGFTHRTAKINDSYKKAKALFFEECITQEELDQLFKDSAAEIKNKRQTIGKFFSSETKKADEDEKKKLKKECEFDHSMLCRLLLSILIDSDRQDTADFMENKLSTPDSKDLSEVWADRLNFLESKISKFSCDTPVQKSRAEFSRLCADFKYAPSGIYSLSLPTGAGKTLASLRSALTIARNNNLKHIIFVIPLLSVLDQNAHVIREYVGNDDIILEHHSNVIRNEAENDNAEDEKRDLLQNSWDKPIIITTMVQFLNTLFDHRTSCIRRMKSLAESVIVFDEVQSLPHKIISCFNLAINYMTRFEKTSIILCSATLPCLDKTIYGMDKPKQIIPYTEYLWKPFERVNYIVDNCKYIDIYGLKDMTLEQLEKWGNVLVICNKKSQAQELYCLLKESVERLYHLSTSMCMAHRIDKLKCIREDLSEKRPIVCVSTQLVEAGIDFSFGCVIRIFAGLDNIVQSAGRCNRNGEYKEKRPVYSIRLKGEDLGHLPDILKAQNALTNTLADGFNDISSDEAVMKYYNSLFCSNGKEALDYKYKNLPTSVLEMLSSNSQFIKERNCLLNQAFKTAGEYFEVFENATSDVVVPYKDGKDLIAELGSSRAQNDFTYRKKILDKLSKYTVSVYDKQLKTIKQSGGIYVYEDDIMTLNPGFYSGDYGLSDNYEGDNDFLGGI